MNNNASIKDLKLLTFIPMFLFFLFFTYLLVKDYKELNAFKQLENSIYIVEKISKLVTVLQKERGISSIYTSSDGKVYSKELSAVYKNVDNAFIPYMKHKKYEIIRNAQQKKLLLLRTATSKNAISAYGKYIGYTDIIEVVLKNYRKIVYRVKDSSVKNILENYTTLIFMQEALGQIRGSVSMALSSVSYLKTVEKKIHYAHGIFNLTSRKFLATGSENSIKKFRHLLNSHEYKYMQKALYSYKPKNKYLPIEWFEIVTHIMDELISIQHVSLQNIKARVSEKSKDLHWSIAIEFLLLFGMAAFMSLESIKLKNSILKNMKLLDGYKHTVDRSSIVSKTDISGRITYANDQFCNISGYTREELLGKPHNIVRHPDVPKSVFKDLWKTILNKKPWFGVVKNRKKDGTAYIVEATINPILNHKGEIEEFIAIRNDITEQVKLEEEIEETQKELIFRMGEIVETRSEETGYHVKRVAKYSELFARYYGLNEEEIKNLTYASPMHDIGKVAIPDAILNKEGKLTTKEIEIVKRHAEIGYRIFSDSEKPLLKTAAIIAHEHHEKYDGSGYPRGLKGEEIHIFGRITAIADVFDALGSKRCYKDAWSDEDIFTLLKEERGKHFDPKLVDIFFEHLDAFMAVRDAHVDKV